MNHLDSDLEEGEIIDSPPLSPKLNSNKEKKLPQRYIVKDNKSPIHKHKRGCRHSVRHHAKKLTKLKKTPVRKKNITKLYHKPSCSYEKSHRDFDRHDISDTFKHVLPKNGSFPHNSLIAEMKGSLKNVPSLKKLSKNLDKSRSQRVPFSQKNFKTSENNITISEVSNARLLKNGVDKSVTSNVGKKIEYLPERENTCNSLIDLSKSPDHEVPEIEIIIPEVVVPPLIDLTNLDDEPINNHLNHVQNVNAISNNSSQVKEEESEDEEELRRIALATCAKRKVLKESQTTIQNTENPCNASVPDISNVNVQISHKVTNKETADNYEVIDMEVDDDTQITTEIIETNQKSETAQELFIIDKNPSNEFLQNKTNEFPEAPIADNSDDEDFEVNILRAELITNMFRKKLLQEDKEQLNIAKHKKLVHFMQQKKHLVNYTKSNLQFSYKRLKTAKHFLRKRSVNKLVSTNNTIKPPLPVQVSKPSERLIITVNGESSDDSDEEANKDPENPVDSIVALISDCRQKSKCTSEAKEKEVVPQALSCLSKAQQEEYNSLMKILEKKKKVPEKAVSSKNAHFELDELKKLEKKLVVLTGDQKKKKQSMAVLSEEVTSKKLCYMKAKLTTQHLKEQLVAAEKVRRAKLVEWSKTCDNLKLMKQSVTDLEMKINEVQNLCSKIGSSLQGQSYKLPSLPSSNEQS